MYVTRKLVEQELGRAVLHALEQTAPADQLAAAAGQRALDVLQKIHDIVENRDLSDFDCVEEIVCTLEEAGIGTSRHDF